MKITKLGVAPRLAPSYVKAVLAARRSGTARPLPERMLLREWVPVDRSHLAVYARVCGFARTDELPISYPHVLGFSMALELMTARDFPFPLLGLVHLANSFSQIRAIDADEQLELRVSAGDPGEHRRGRTFVLTTEVSSAGQPVWTGRSTYLHRSGAGSGGPREDPPPAPPGPASARWSVPADAGRRYGAVSGDRNPIHLHPLTARLFGFPRPIAHGMWTTARCLAALDARLPAAVDVSVQFTAPVPLPSTVDFHSGPVDGGWEFSLHGKGGRRHLTGTAATPGSSGAP